MRKGQSLSRRVEWPSDETCESQVQKENRVFLVYSAQLG